MERGEGGVGGTYKETDRRGRKAEGRDIVLSYMGGHQPGDTRPQCFSRPMVPELPLWRLSQGVAGEADCLSSGEAHSSFPCPIMTPWEDRHSSPSSQTPWHTLAKWHPTPR
ncbi:hypothetical protein E2C01_069735 [Portunus trituberculatus]|uniref:Uncharacterized protein n=1 Tax=Portunus trituberculatus TaxID=210409 RepID=A0A5B7I0D0_PORTR|nr:hypothetical protein [Portunus trituberculatus]